MANTGSDQITERKSVSGAQDGRSTPPQAKTSDRTSRELPRFSGPLRPLVDLVARAKVGVGAKLLGGFLIGALLLLGMGVLSLVVIGRMGQRVDDLTRLQEKV